MLDLKFGGLEVLIPNQYSNNLKLIVGESRGKEDALQLIH